MEIFMDKVLEFLAAFNVQTILAMGLLFWYFSRDIKNEMKLIEAKMDRQSKITDRLYEMFISLIKEIKK